MTFMFGNYDWSNTNNSDIGLGSCREFLIASEFIEWITEAMMQSFQLVQHDHVCHMDTLSEEYNYKYNMGCQ